MWGCQPTAQPGTSGLLLAGVDVGVGEDELFLSALILLLARTDFFYLLSMLSSAKTPRCAMHLDANGVLLDGVKIPR